MRASVRDSLAVIPRCLEKKNRWESFLKMTKKISVTPPSREVRNVERRERKETGNLIKVENVLNEKPLTCLGLTNTIIANLIFRTKRVPESRSLLTQLGLMLYVICFHFFVWKDIRNLSMSLILSFGDGINFELLENVKRSWLVDP